MKEINKILFNIPYSVDTCFFIMVRSTDSHFSSLKQDKPVHSALDKGN